MIEILAGHISGHNTTVGLVPLIIVHVVVTTTTVTLTGIIFGEVNSVTPVPKDAMKTPTKIVMRKKRFGPAPTYQ